MDGRRSASDRHMPYNTGLLWVNYDPGNSTSSLSTSEIFRHVQRGRAKRARGTRISLLNRRGVLPWTKVDPTEVSQLPSPPDSQCSEGEPENRSDEGHQTALQLRPASKKSQDSSESTRVAIPLKRKPTLVKQSFAPLNILRKGNSDPFTAVAITIDPNAAMLITFIRDKLLLSLYGHHWQASGGTKCIQQYEWETTVKALQDEGAAHAMLARAATVLSIGGGQHATRFEHLAVALKIKGSVMLRTELVNIENLQFYDERLCLQVFTLMQNAVFGRQLEEARIHTSMLQRLLQLPRKPPDDGSHKLEFLFLIAYNDVQSASMSFQRTQMDLDGWMPSQFRPLWISTDRYQPLKARNTYELDVSLGQGRLRTLYLAQRDIEARRGQFASDPSAATSQTWLSLLSQAIVAYGQMHNFCIDCKISAEDTLAGPADLWRGIQGVAALAAVLWARQLRGTENLSVGPGATIYGANHLLLHHLREALSMLLMAGVCYGDKYHSTVLWALYVGAAITRGVSVSHIEGISSVRDWFDDKIARHAHIMNVESWVEAQVILRGFLYGGNMVLHIDGSLWFDGILANLQAEVA